jgi:sulfonate dioxygenase
LLTLSSRLSPTFAGLLDGLKTEQTSAKMINHARQSGGLVRKDAVHTIHPLVRIHPVTSKKCLFLNGEFVTKIHGMKETESKVILDHLMQHMITGHDFQVRVKWAPRTVVMFDNRSTIRTTLTTL